MKWSCTRTFSSRSCSTSCGPMASQPDRVQSRSARRTAGARPHAGGHSRYRRSGDRSIARRLGVHPAVVCVKWAVQRGADADPALRQPRVITWRICRRSERAADRRRIWRAIAGIDRNCRLIKGQVFLWKQDQTWEDLWDVNGVIADNDRRVSFPATAPSNCERCRSRSPATAKCCSA